MTDSRPVTEQYNEFLGILGRFTQHKMIMDEAIQVSCIIDKLSPSWKDFKHTLKHLKEELTLVELDNHPRIEESLRVQDSDKPIGNNVVGPSVVNMVKHNNSSRYNDNNVQRKHHDNTKADPNKKSKVTCWKCGKSVHLKKDCTCGKVGNKANGSAFMSTSKLNDSILWHARLGHVYFKRMQDMSKDELILTFDMDTEKFCYVYLLHTKDEALDKFKVFKTEAELQQGSPIKRFRTDKGGEYMDTQYFQSVGIRDEVSDQHSYCFNVEDDPKTFDEAMKSQDVDMTKEFLSSRFSMKDMREADVILGIRIKHKINGIAISQSHYIEKVLKKFNYFDCTPVSSPMDTSE
ncbi:zinc finger, CCHC-type containing protein [Tanacetum coccineum]